MWAALPIFLFTLSAISPVSGAPVAKRPRGPVLVPFTTRKVFWRMNPKTNREEYRTEVEETPNELASAASIRLGKPVPVQTFALATLIASEVGSAHPLAKVAVAHAARNMARRKKIPVMKLLVPDGKFGSQHGRYAATKSAPTVEDLKIAEAVEAGKVRDPAGAIQWDSPSAQTTLFARGEPGYDDTADDVARRRLAAGRRLVVLPGIDPNYLRLWA